ncbi:hypothetical protein ACHAWC_000909, partial [Mediolabrus comicus]
PYASCPGFNISVGTHNHYLNENRTEDGLLVTTRWVAVNDYVVWKSDDKEGTKLCFPKAKATWTAISYPDSTTSITTEGSGLMLITERDNIAEGITSVISKPGTYYQEGTRTGIMAIDADDDRILRTVTDVDGTFIDVCELLSSPEAVPLQNEKSQSRPRPPPALFGALSAAAIQSDLPSCNSLGISSRNTCTNYCIGKGYNQLMSQWYEGVCSCVPKDTMQATPVCKAGGSLPSTSAPTNSPIAPTPPSPTPPTPTSGSCDIMGITNSDQCATGCSSRNNLDMSTWIQQDGDSLCICGWGNDQYVLCENTTSGATVLSGLMMTALLASGTAMMMLL